MNCPKCNQPTENGAVFCGNCGQPLSRPPIHQAKSLSNFAMSASGAHASTLPTYALPNPYQQAVEFKTMLALVLGITGIVGAVVVPILGLALGTAGLITATTTHNGIKKLLFKAALVFSTLAILAGLAMWAYNVQHDPRFNNQVTRAQPTGSAAIVDSSASTPCYSLDFIDQLNISHQADSCDMNAFNGKSLETSTNAYKISATKADISDANTFSATARQAIEADVSKNMPGFSIDRQRVASFAGSPAYIVNVSDKANNVSIVEAAILHKTDSGYNVFIVLHANNGPEADLQILEAGWQWQ